MCLCVCFGGGGQLYPFPPFLLTVLQSVSVSFGFVSDAQVRTCFLSLSLFIISQLLFWVLLKGKLCPLQGKFLGVFPPRQVLN